MKIKRFVLLIPLILTALLICGCDLNNEIPPPSLPATVYGQLPTGTAIIQAAEAAGAANVQIVYYLMATGTSENSGAVNTEGGFRPNWWKEERAWCGVYYIPTLTSVKVVYDETANINPEWSVERSIRQLFQNAGFYDVLYGPGPFDVETTTDNAYRLLSLPTHAAIINALEQLGASNVKIIQYIVYREGLADSAPPPMIGYITYYFHHNVPADSSFSAHQGELVSDNETRILRLSYEHPGLGSIITNNDVEEAIRKLFSQYGFASINVMATGTQFSASFPLPSFSQITQAAERAGVVNANVNVYKANNTDVIPMNEGIMVVNTPVVVEITYDGAAIAEVNANVQALFANFNNVHIGNNAVALIPLPSKDDIHLAAIRVLYFPADWDEPGIYTANGETIEYSGSAAWNARIKIVIRGNGTNEAVYANLAVQNIKWLFTGRGFFNLNITVNYP